ncbi:dihydropteroate synthase [Candidatus Binatia bacterium]|nr:dihydropteroate synthase [Candidatus Binatia bacterium]
MLAGIAVGDGYPVRIVGVINVSPESFHAGSVTRGAPALRQRARAMVAEGADILDVGAMSTAPYRQGSIDAREERRRLLAAVVAVCDAVAVPVSVDTQRAEVAAAALDAGAAIVNDVSGFAGDPEMAGVARRAGGVVLMARETERSTASPLRVVTACLRAALRRADAAGLPRERIVLDPGIGFFRQAAVPWHAFDCEVLARLQALRPLGHPLLVGVSRKSFVGYCTGRQDPADRLAGSLGATAVAVRNGAQLVRTHDIAATIDVVRIVEAILARAAKGGA